LKSSDVYTISPEVEVQGETIAEALPRSGHVWLMPDRWVILDDVLQANAEEKVCFT
jgi:hypothetical protein